MRARPGELTQAAVLLFQTVQFPPLFGRSGTTSPEPEFLGTDFDEITLLAVHALDTIYSGVIKLQRAKDEKGHPARIRRPR